MLTETTDTVLLAGVGITPDCPRIGQVFEEVGIPSRVAPQNVTAVATVTVPRTRGGASGERPKVRVLQYGHGGFWNPGEVRFLTAHRLIRTNHESREITAPQAQSPLARHLSLLSSGD